MLRKQHKINDHYAEAFGHHRSEHVYSGQQCVSLLKKTLLQHFSEPPQLKSELVIPHSSQEEKVVFGEGVSGSFSLDCDVIRL